MSVAIWNCHSLSLDVSSNMKLPFLTTTCQWQCEIAIPDHYMSVVMWNCHAWQLDVSTGGVYLNLNTSSENLGLSVNFIWNWRGISDSLSRNCNWKFELTSHLGHFTWQVSGGYIWIWTLHLKIWISVCTSFETEGGISDSSFGYCIWKFELTSHLGHFIWQFLWGELWNCHSWPVDVSSNVKLPFLTTRCQ